MFKKTTHLIALFLIQFSFSQSIDVNPVGAIESSYDLTQLVNEVLTDNCSQGTNLNSAHGQGQVITAGGNNNNQGNSFGYFTYTPPAGQTANDTNFPFEKGIVLSSGREEDSEGPNTLAINTGHHINGNPQVDNSWSGDSDLKEILDERFNDDVITYNATVVEFDFVPLVDEVSFDYVFASEEYESGGGECPGQTVQDGFAFIISGPGITQDLKANGQPFAHSGKNIALIPGTNIPVSVGTIYNNINDCGQANASSNPQFYNSYTGANATGSPIRFNARTDKFTAQENVVAGQTYHLKIVIADRGDAQYDSAVFLDSGSFTTAPVLTIGGVVVGETQPICQGGSGTVTIDGTMNLPGLTGAVTYQWSHNGVDMTIANGYAQDENNSQLTTNVNGTYTLTATLPLSGGACDTVDSATITFLPDTTIGTVLEMRACETTQGGGTASFNFDTPANTTLLLNGQAPALYSVSYHANQADADSGANPITTYNGASTQLFARVILTADPAFCFATSSFNLTVDTVPTANLTTTPAIIRKCDVISAGNLVNEETFDLTAFTDDILDNQTGVSLSYFDNSTTPPTLIPTANVAAYVSGTTTIGVTVSNDANTTCTASTTFEIITDLIPVATQPTEMRACDDEDTATGDILGEETFDLTTQNEAILGGPVAAGGLDPTLFTVNYHYVDSSNNNIAIITPTAYVLDIPYPAFSQEIFATVTNNINNICSTTTSFFIFRDAIYTTAVPSADLNITLCDDNNPGDMFEEFNLNAQIQTILGSGGVTPAEATVTFYTTETDAIANTVANAITVADASNFTSTTTNVAPFTQTIYYTISNNSNVTCFSTGSLQLQVNALPTITAPSTTLPATIFKACDLGIIDGYTEFDFTSPDGIDIINIITQNNTTYGVSFFATALDAQNNTNELSNPYTNTTQNAQTIHVRVVDTITGCVILTTLNLEVVTAPQAFPFTNPLTYCDTDNDDVGYFDLNSIVLELTGNIPGVTVEFFETEAEADFSVENPSVGVIPTDVLYENINSDADQDGNPATQTIFAQLSINGLNCVTLVEVDLVVIKSPELPSNDLVYKLCETVDNPLTDPFNESLDGFVLFDLVSYELTNLYTEIINAGGDPSEYTASYYLSDVAGNVDYANPINTPNAYTNEETPDQLIYVVVEHTGSVSVAATGCSTIKAITLHVDLLPVAEYTQIEVCDDNDVNSLPPNNTSDGIIEFDLTDYIGQITGGATGVEVEFYKTAIAAEAGLGAATVPSTDFIAVPTAYENEFNPQAIFARVLNSTTGCHAVAIVALHVNPNPTPLSTSEIESTLGNNGVMEECDGNVDGSGDISEQIATFDLTLWETVILNGENGVSAVYYATSDDAAAETNAIQNPATYNNISNPQTIYVSVVNDGFGINPVTNGTGCNTVVTFQVFVPVPSVEITSSKTVICVDANGVPLTDTTLPILTANALPLAPYDYQWMLNGAVIPGATVQTYSVTEHGDYTVVVSGPTDFDCINVSSAVTIEVSGVPDGFDANVTTNAFAESHQIVATATSSIPGIEFWYSLDGAEATTNGTFENVSPGAHVVTISDGKNCWTENIDVTLIDYPHFFTPNGDGVNDTWRIIGQEGIPISQIYIFDRFGKLLSQLDPNSEGWDGAYNGSQMPASDYWFKILYVEGTDSSQKEFKAHFSLKR